MHHTIPYSPYNKQKEIHNDLHRFKVIVAGRRAGKTTMAVNEIIKRALNKSGEQIWYIAPTYRQAKMIAWRMLTNFMPEVAIKRKNESELSLELKNGSYISLKGAENEDSLRGVYLTFVIFDETADIKENVWPEIIRPTLADKKGDAWFIGTPKGYNHFYNLFMKEAESEHWKSWKLKSLDNPHLDPEELRVAKLELPEDVYAQEFEGEFKKFTGLIYPEFEREKHVEELDINFFRNNRGRFNFYRTIDFGTHNPTAVLFIATDGEKSYVFDEIYQSGITFANLAELIKAKSGGLDFITTYRDPSALQMGIELERYGIYTTPGINTVDNQKLGMGITKVRGFFKEDRIVVAKHCTNTIYELENYRYVEVNSDQPDKSDRSVIFKKNDHAMDALRYYVETKDSGKENYQPIRKPSKPSYVDPLKRIRTRI